MTDLEEYLEEYLEESVEESVDEQNICRICFEPHNESHTLIQPCNCKTSYVHETCLLKWLKTSHRTNCEICLFQYNIHKKPTKKPLLFADNPVFNRNILFLGGCILFPCAPVSFYIGCSAQDVYYAINLIFILLIFGYVRYVKILPTLAFWKFCLTLGMLIVCLEINYFPYVYFDFGVSGAFAFGACLCYKNTVCTSQV